MGIIVTAGVYFIFGFIVGSILMIVAVGGIVYDHCKYNDPKSTEAVNKLYDVGKRFFGKK